MVAAVGTYLAPHFGWRIDAVISGSMEPELKAGSLVVARPVEPESIIPGDIITFYLQGTSDTAVTHRVIDIKHNSPLYFETKGDANEQPDPFIVPARDLLGKICIHIPYLGYMTEFLKTPYGYILGLAIPTVIIIAVYIRSVYAVITNSINKKTSELSSG
jgi:signal peptidase